MSGYPSVGINDEGYTDTRTSSMSYFLLHANSDLQTEYIGQGQGQDVANLNDIDDSESFNGPSYVSNNMPLHGGQDQLQNGINTGMENLNMHRQLNNAVFSRRNGNQVGLTNSVQPIGERGVGVASSVQPVGVASSVQPMGEREAPEGRSITYVSENGNFGNDMQQTYRKVAVNEFDSDLTNEKQMMGTDTQTELDTDDELTEYKRKLKETQIDEIYPDMQSKEDSIKSENNEDSKAEYNVEDILYEEDDTLTGASDKSVSDKTNESDEKSFELESIDVKNMQTDYKAANEVAKFESTDEGDDDDNGDKVSESFEIGSEDIKRLGKFKQPNDNGSQLGCDEGERLCSSEQTEESFELNSYDIEEIKKEGETSRPVTDEIRYNDDSTESSFEIDPAEILDINVPDNTNIAKPCDRKEGERRADNVKDKAENYSIIELIC